MKVRFWLETPTGEISQTFPNIEKVLGYVSSDALDHVDAEERNDVLLGALQYWASQRVKTGYEVLEGG